MLTSGGASGEHSDVLEKKATGFERAGDSSLRRRRLELGLFLRQRRAALRPHDVGLPALGRRHVKGLRREELASVAGISGSWYALLEQGRAETVTPRTMAAIADALRLSPIERRHLLELADTSYRELIDAFPRPGDALVQFVRDYPVASAHLNASNFDIVAYNAACARFFYLADHGPNPNLLRVMVDETRLRSRFVAPTWDVVLHSMVGHFRILYGEFGGAPFDALVAELGAKSELFRSYWAERALFSMPPNPIVIDDDGERRAFNVFGFTVPEAPSYYLVMHAPTQNV